MQPTALEPGNKQSKEQRHPAQNPDHPPHLRVPQSNTFRLALLFRLDDVSILGAKSVHQLLALQIQRHIVRRTAPVDGGNHWPCEAISPRLLGLAQMLHMSHLDRVHSGHGFHVTELILKLRLGFKVRVQEFSVAGRLVPA